MAVYVDYARNSAPHLKGRRARYLFCHMVADSISELHEMADRIGVARKWFQDKASFPHYDIVQTKRVLAVKYGAVEIGWRELATFMQEYRGRQLLWTRTKILLKKWRSIR